MKREYLYWLTISLILCVNCTIYAQYGYGTIQPSKAAILHLKSEKKGLLIPRVPLVDTHTFLPNSSVANDSLSVNSLLVYNVSQQNDLMPGFYYWITDGTTGKWNRLITDAETIEPWQVQGTMDKATENTQNIYQTGSVVIGKNTTAVDVMLDVAGAFRTGVLDTTNASIGSHSIASGNKNIASGEYASAFGHSSEAIDYYSFAAGRETVAYGTGATSFGRESRAHGNYSFAAGRRAVAGTKYEAVLGGYNVLQNEHRDRWEDTDPIFQIGIGTSPIAANRKNALTILKNGKVGIGNFATNNTVKPQEIFHIGTGDTILHRLRIEDLPKTTGTVADSIVVVDNDGILKSIKTSSLKSNGPWYSQNNRQPTNDNTEAIYQQGAIAIWKDTGIPNVALDVKGPVRIGTANSTEAIGQYSLAGGQTVIASGNNAIAFGTRAKARGGNSIAIGNQAETIGSNSAALGNNTLASGSGSVALGYNTEATGSYAIAVGHTTEAAGNNAAAFGENTYAHSRSEFVIGRYNEVVTGSKTSWTLSNPIFQIGIGTDSTDRKNAVTVRKNGWVGIGVADHTDEELLSVAGSIQTAGNLYPDYVFEKYYEGRSEGNPTYNFMSLMEIKAFVEKNHHLPNIPKATDLARTDKGEYVFNITELSLQSLEKIEELYLYLIEQEEKYQMQKQQLAYQEEEIRLLKMRLRVLENLLLEEK